MVEALASKILTAPKYRYSQMVKAGPNFVCSGMIALDNDSGALIVEGVGGQTRKIFENIKVLMSEFSLAWNNLVNVRIFTTEFENFGDINAVWEEVFTEDKVPPARSAVGVSALPLNAKVEIEFVFYKDI